MKQLVDAHCIVCGNRFIEVPVDKACGNFKCSRCDDGPGDPRQLFHGMRVVLGRLGVIPPPPKTPSCSGVPAKA
jgi:hypothetical protein